MSLEGELRVRLQVEQGRVAQVHITSTRPDAAALLLQGRTLTLVAAAVPRLFSVCSRSQGAANELVSAAATGEPVTRQMLARCSAAVSAEMLAEHARRALLDWPQWLGETPSADAIGAARMSCDAPQALHARAIALAAFGMPADEWLALHAEAELDRWADAGLTPVARGLHSLRDDDALAPTPAATPLLAIEPPEAGMAALAHQCDDDEHFAAHPTWHGKSAETGPLARQQADPLILQLLRRPTARLAARHVARLRELALLLTGRLKAAVGALNLPGRGGVAWVENARGLLVHRLQLDHGRVASYRILAPTEWNFHPAGSLASSLNGSAATDLDALHLRALRLVRSLDPCVACHVEVHHA